MNSKDNIVTHLPVMLPEVLEAFDDSPNGWFIDGTFGLGGHSRGLLERYPERKVFGIDLDSHSTGISRKGFQKYTDRVVLVNGNYADMKTLTREANINSVGGILLDLGLSSMQLETEGRGFSFRTDEILDMRYNQSQQITAFDVINTWEEKELSDIFFQFGEERAARRIARAICDQRPIMTTGKLAKVVEEKIGKSKKLRIHPATKIFQALRIAVNQEFENINTGLSAGLELLADRGKFVVLTYHSLEDRIVKQFFKKESLNCICPVNIPVCICDHKSRLRIVNKKVKTPSSGEIQNNPRSRSAKMRIVEKIV